MPTASSEYGAPKTTPLMIAERSFSISRASVRRERRDGHVLPVRAAALGAQHVDRPCAEVLGRRERENRREPGRHALRVLSRLQEAPTVEVRASLRDEPTDRLRHRPQRDVDVVDALALARLG